MLASHADSPAPPDRLWEVVADVARWPDHLPTFSSVTREGDGPLETGARYRVRQPGLPSATYEVTATEPGRSFTWVARSPGVTTTAVHTVTVIPEGSRLDLAIDWGGPLGGLVRGLVGRRAQRMIDVEASTLARVAATDG